MGVRSFDGFVTFCWYSTFIVLVFCFFFGRLDGRRLSCVDGIGLLSKGLLEGGFVFCFSFGGWIGTVGGDFIELIPESTRFED